MIMTKDQVAEVDYKIIWMLMSKYYMLVTCVLNVSTALK